MAGENLTHAEFDRGLAACRPAMYRFACTLVGLDDADDVVQEASERAWKKWAQFDPGRGSLRPWLFAILADRVRRRRRRRTPPILTTLPPGILTLPDMDPTAIDLSRTVEQLPPRQRSAIVLFYYLDLPIAEIASIMDCAEGTVKSSLHDARAALARSLGGAYADQC